MAGFPCQEVAANHFWPKVSMTRFTRRMSDVFHRLASFTILTRAIPHAEAVGLLTEFDLGSGRLGGIDKFVKIGQALANDDDTVILSSASSCAVKVTMPRKSIWRCRSSRHLLVSGTSRLWRYKVGLRRKKLLTIINKLKLKLQAKQRLPAPVLIRTVPALALAQVRLPTLLQQTPDQSSASLLKVQMRQVQTRTRMI